MRGAAPAPRTGLAKQLVFANQKNKAFFAHFVFAKQLV
jgi:hypothetical protein